MLSIREQLDAARTPKQPSFDVWIAELEPDDRDAMIEAATDPRLSNRQIMEIVNAAGRRTSKETISAWRKAHGFHR